MSALHYGTQHPVQCARFDIFRGVLCINVNAMHIILQKWK